MEKKRVYTIADEIGITSKELIAKLEELDIKVSSHMSTLTREEADIIVEMFKEEKAVKVKPKEKEVKKVDLVLEHTEHEEEPENKKSEKQDKKEKNKKQDKKESKNTGHIEIRKEEKQESRSG